MTDRTDNATNQAVREKVSEQAFEWLLKFDAGQVSAADQRIFAAWLKQSPLHGDEYLQLTATWRELDGVDLGHHVNIDHLLKTAPVNVVSIPAHSGQPATRPGNTMRRGRTVAWLAALAATVLLAVAGPGLFQWYAADETLYSTVRGEQTSFTLDDGSVLHLNTQSRIRVRLTHAERHIELVTGEALFDVAKDPNRPFRVHTAQAVVQVLGTQFNIYQQQQRTMITVVDGKVAVQAHQPQARAADTAATHTPFTLAARQQASIAAGGAVSRQNNVDTKRITAWRQRQLVFREDTLAHIASEFNRYNRAQIVVAGKRAAKRRLTGVFKADDPRSLVQFLQEDPSLVISEWESPIMINDK